MALLEIHIPQVAIQHRDEEEGAQQHNHRSQMAEKRPLRIQKHGRKIDGDPERKEMIKPAQAHAVMPLQPPSRQHHQAIEPRHAQDQDQALKTFRKFRHEPEYTRTTRA